MTLEDFIISSFFLLGAGSFIFGIFTSSENKISWIAYFLGIVMIWGSIFFSIVERNTDVEEIEKKTGCSFIQADKDIAYMECVDGVKLFRMID